MTNAKSASKSEFRAMMRNKSKIEVFSDLNNLTLPVFAIDGVKTTKTKYSQKTVFWVPNDMQKIDNGMILKVVKSDHLWEVTRAEDDIVGNTIIKRVYDVITVKQ